MTKKITDPESPDQAAADQTDQENPDQTDAPVPNGTAEGTDQENPDQAGTDQGEPETFPRDYVEKLRTENAENRVKAKRADDLAARLHAALTAATGRLADPTDLPFDESHLDDPEALTAAIEALLERKPHLATRTPRGDVGQGATQQAGGVDLASLLRARA